MTTVIIIMIIVIITRLFIRRSIALRESLQGRLTALSQLTYEAFSLNADRPEQRCTVRNKKSAIEEAVAEQERPRPLLEIM